MRKFLFLSCATALLSGFLSELSFISWRYSLVFYLLFFTINLIFFLAYKYDDLFLKAFKKLLDYLLIKDAESYNLAVIFMWSTFNVCTIIWRWSYVR
jgi:hypothetical protein